jgi:hypothetical protein
MNAFEALRAMLDDPALLEFADLIPIPPKENGGVARYHPNFVFVLYMGLADELHSALQAQALLADTLVWPLIRQWAKERFPNEPEMCLHETPVQTWHYDYIKKRYLTQSWTSGARYALSGQGVKLAKAIGLFDPDQTTEIGADGIERRVSFTRPAIRRSLRADGVVITPRSKYDRKTCRVIDGQTGEILRYRRFDPSARLHTTGGGKPVFGTKHQFLSARGYEEYERAIIDVMMVENNSELKTLYNSLNDVMPRLPAAQAIQFDGAARGEHSDHIMKNHGVLLIAPKNKVADPKDQNKKNWSLQQYGTVTAKGGDGRDLKLWLRDAYPSLEDVGVDGSTMWVPLKKVTTIRKPLADGAWTIKTQFEVPEEFGGGRLWLRLDTSDEDKVRGFNRAENLRSFSPLADPAEWSRVYYRNDAESINRNAESHMPDGRARSFGAEAQLVDLIAYGFCWNAKVRWKMKHAPPGVMPTLIPAA